jgi:hypothetical protein
MDRNMEPNKLPLPPQQCEITRGMNTISPMNIPDDGSIWLFQG